MGAEAYGLIGFFSMLQAWFTLLDMGLTPTISRETARYYGGSISSLTYRQLFRSLSVIFSSIALLGGGSLWLLAETAAQEWLLINELDKTEVVLALQIMAIIVSLRWLGGLYRGVITGSERLVWLSGFNAIIASLRFVAVFASMWMYGFTPTVFFLHQLIIALIEIAGLFLMSNRLLPRFENIDGTVGWSIQPVKPILQFALTIAFTSSIWVLVTQTDKLILSGILQLTEYGYFTLAVLVASGVLVISSPISSAIMPRMARLHAEGKHDELIKVYRNATQLVSVIAGTAAISLVFCAEPLLYAWTGDYDTVNHTVSILRLYAIGNGFLAVASFPYYLQYALGNLRYHLIGNVGMVIFLIPGIIISAIFYGGKGAGYAWVILNSLFLLTWVGYVHHKLVPGLHKNWLLKDIFTICIPVAVIAFAISIIEINLEERLSALVFVIILSIAALALGAAMSSYVRESLIKRFFG